MTVADALELGALPDRVRERIAQEIRRAYLAGFERACALRDADANTGEQWTGFIDEQCADLWHWNEVEPVIAVDVSRSFTLDGAA